MSTYDDASLVLIPSGVKDGKVYSAKPTNGDGDFTFTRASEASRVNSDGLIEKVRTNLITYSEDFSNSFWTKANASVTGGFTSPDGTNNAYKLVASGTNGEVRLGFSTSNNNDKCVSVFAKATTTTSKLTIAEANYNGKRTDFDLNLGVITFSDSTSSKIEDYGNGWFRCTNVQAFPSGQNAAVFSFRSLLADSFLIYGAQLEVGSVATDYIKTTGAAVSVGPVANLPRLDYGGGATCPSLLLEPQRTNLVSYSESMNQYTAVNGTVIPNVLTSPDGLLNAVKFAENSANNLHYFDSNSISVTSGTKYTISVFAKYNGRFLTLQGSSALSSAFATFNLQNGTIEQESVGTASIEKMPNDWYRCSIIVQMALTGNAVMSILLNDSATGGRSRSYQGNGSSGVYLYGFQVEAGNYETSYIPSYGTAATRVADACSKTGISSLIGQTEGTMYCEIDFESKKEAGSPIVGIMTLNNNVANLQNGIVLGIERQSGGTNRFYPIVQVGNSTVASVIGPALTDGIYKAAFAYKENDFVLYVNGVQVGTDSSGAVPTTSQVLIGERFNVDSYKIGDGVNQALLFKTRLTNAELETLTTL